jgi:hypothetical protein
MRAAVQAAMKAAAMQAESNKQPAASNEQRAAVIRPKRIYIPEPFCCYFSSNLCVLNTTNTN